MVFNVFIDVYVEHCNRTLVEYARKLGYSILACQVIEEQLNDIPVGIVGKSVITASSVKELKNKLREADYRRNIITIHPLSIEVARWASHDNRVDSILLTGENIEVFDKKQASIMKYYSKPLEILLPLLLHGDHEIRGIINRRLNLFTRSKVGFLIGSKAREWSELYSPFSIIKILSTQYDIPEYISSLALTDIPRQVVSSKERFKHD